jgi:hypothetical protein
VALPGRILRHRAAVVGQVAADRGAAEWVAGEPAAGSPPAPAGTPFRCVLFLPVGAEEDNPYRPRNITRPTLLYNAHDEDGGLVVLVAESELELTAAAEPENVRAMLEGRWQVDGDPAAFGPPGRNVGLMATLQRVRG